MEDIYSELDAVETVISGEAEITLTDDDYDALDLGFGNFSSEDDAKQMLPSFLSKKYPTWGKESLASVTFKLYNPKRDEKSLAVYEVDAADYTAQGGNVARFGNFSSYNDIVAFLNTKYPSAENRLLVSLTYKYYNGASVVELNNGFINNSGTWEMSTGITDDEYTSMGESRAQFSFEDEALAKIPVFLKDRFKYESKVAGDIEGIMYKLYVTDTQDVDGDGRTDDRTVYSFVAFFIYDGVNWTKYNNVIDQTIKFGHDGTNWVPDNTIKYTLTAADYALVGNDRYGNFDVRSGRDEETVEARVAKINTILLNNFPNDAEGQKYLVSYNIYNGANGVWTMAVIKTGGEYVLQ
ncbi:hypothetical protein DIS07_06365 [Polaribacter aquimarinus]|uniref:Uncharacterized protein n=2 Tax=Polaribacter aquimarinus TaxID=2100726 RepID=A0A2U2JCL4_9FLAO|nr:hypothetical protein DIS07_06365 [Polaribacter aquimarinus]